MHQPSQRYDEPRRFTIGLVINPTAGLGKGVSAGKKVVDEFARYNVTVKDLSAHTARDALARARGACLDPLDALVVVGGDGMVNLGLNAVIGTPTPLGIIAAGSGNDFARALELPTRNVKRSVALIVDALTHGRVSEYDAAQVEPYVAASQHSRLRKHELAPAETHAESARRWYAGTLSLGLDAAVNAQANTYAWPKGHLKYMRAVIACIARFKPYGYAITVNSRRIETTGTLVAISNAPYFGGGLHVAPHADMMDGLLDFIFAQPLTKAGIFKVFPKLYAGRHLEDPAIATKQVREIIIEPSSSGQFPPVAMADGEVIGPVPLKIVAHRKVLRVLT
ncbi:diacylglycerol/lipid kinase family protein [Timonella sp. A28]|uniref:diacylglycerol/lipid kinase family protein n=1 Tax=Timonella sp. A28 TaxID=3442640 RepID=UPI003EBA18BC